MEENKFFKRVTEIDFLRGIAVIAMMLDHFMFDIYGIMPRLFSDFPTRGGASMKLYDTAVAYWNWDVRLAVRYAFLAIFFGLSGVCCSFSRSNIKRGIKLLLVSLLLTAATYAAGRAIGDENLMITFGVLHCMALAMLLIGLLEVLRANKWIYLALGIVMIASGIVIGADAPYLSYGSESMAVLILKQIVGTAHCGGDCFPFLLYGGQIIVGVFIGKSIYPDRRSVLPSKGYSNNPVTFIGRNSLAVYFAHQIIIPILIGLVLIMLGFTLGI